MSRVFAVGTGRCGSSSFFQAARSLKGWTAGHESRGGIVHDWTFADQHVEVAPQLVYGIPLLRRRYPDARWVHLVRERDACVYSLQRQCWESMTSFAQQWFLVDHPADVAKAAGEFYDRTNDLIEALCPPDLTMRIRTEDLAAAWPAFAAWIGADYDRELAAEALSHRYNPGHNRGRDAF